MASLRTRTTAPATTTKPATSQTTAEEKMGSKIAGEFIQSSVGRATFRLMPDSAETFGLLNVRTGQFDHGGFATPRMAREFFHTTFGWSGDAALETGDGRQRGES